LDVTKKKMGLGKLSQFSGIKKEPELPLPPSDEKTANAAKSEPLADKDEKLVSVNIKITKAQQRWLAETASTVRSNNHEPVPPPERVYPQHLIGIAIDLLRSTDVDWERVKNVGDLQEQLNL
jgi:hypothetical protein